MSPRLRLDRGGVLVLRRRIRRAGGEGLVVQAVLLTVMVMVIALLAMISRVASSRDGAASSSLAEAARQAAEYGFSETVAEMNRDSKGYLWVTPFASWNTVTDANLAACGIHSASAPVADPIAGVASSQSLPGSSELSYQISDYQPPENISSTNCPSFSFANRKGGTATLTIVGTARRASGDITTYTLRRSVSVGAALPEFRYPLTSPAGVSDSAANPRFSHFPNPEELGVDAVAEPWPDATPLPTSFPKDPAGLALPYCQETGTAWICRVRNLTVDSNVLVDTSSKPVNLFVSGSFTIENGKKLCASDATASGCSESNPELLKLRVFGLSVAATTCGQVVNLNNSASRVKGFFWFPGGAIQSSGGSPVDGLAGSFCSVTLAPSAPSSIAPILQQDLINELKDLRLLLYRGYGSREQSS